MVIAIIAGILLASLLFVRSMSELTELKNTTKKYYSVQPAGQLFKVFDINGPLFFAAADRIFGELGFLLTQECNGILLNMENASMIDSGGISSLLKLIEECAAHGTKIHLSNMNRPVARALIKARLKRDKRIKLFTTVQAAQAAFLKK
jgi:SulP family sulfate permease